MNVNTFNVPWRKYFISSILICYLFLMSCSYNTKNDKMATVRDSMSNTSSKFNSKNMHDIRLEYFVGLPAVLRNDGGNVLTYDSVKLDDKKYIFLSNLSGMAAIKINGHEIYLKPDSTKFTSIKDDYYQEVWVGNGIQIVLKLRIVKDFEEDEGEGSYLEGILELKIKNTISKIKIHGYTEV